MYVGRNLQGTYACNNGNKQPTINFHYAPPAQLSWLLQKEQKEENDDEDQEWSQVPGFECEFIQRIQVDRVQIKKNWSKKQCCFLTALEMSACRLEGSFTTTKYQVA